MSREIDELYYELTLHAEGLKSGLDSAERHLGRFSQFIQDNPAAVVAAIGVAMLGVAVKATEMAEETDRAMRRISASLPTGTQGIKDLEESIDNLAARTGAATNELEAAAVQAAKLGAGSAEGVAAVVTAATELSDATGVAIPDAITLFTQLRREFGLTNDQARDTFAKLRKAALDSGVDVSELFNAFARATPAFQKFGIDVDTGTRAITHLVAEGRPVREIGSYINQLDGDGIRQLASHAHTAGDALGDMEKAAAGVESGTDRLNQKIHNELNRDLKELGEQILPKVNSALEFFLSLVSRSSRERIQLGNAIDTLTQPADLASGGAFGNNPQRTALEYLEKTFRARELTDAEAGKHLFGDLPLDQLRQLYETTQAWGASAAQGFHVVDNIADAYKRAAAEANKLPGAKGGGTNNDPLTIPEKQKIATDLAAAQKAVAEFSLSTQKSLAGSTKSAVDNALADLDAFRQKFVELSADIRQKIAALPVNAPASARGALQAQLASLGNDFAAGVEARLLDIDRLSADEASKLKASTSKLLAEVNGQLADSARDAVDQQAKEIERQILLNDKLSAAEKERLLNDVEYWRNLKPVIEDVRNAISKTNLTLTAVSQNGQQDPRAASNALIARELEDRDLQRALVASGGEQAKQAEAYRNLQLDILKIEKARADLAKGDISSTAKIIEDEKKKLAEYQQRVIEVAQNWAAVGRSIIGAAQGLHVMSAETASILQNLVSLGESIAKLFATGGKQGGLEAAGSLVGLISAIADMGHAASRARQQAAALSAEITQLFQGLENALSPTQGNSLAERIAAAKLQYDQARNQIEKDEGGKKHQTQREQDLEKVNALEQQRIEQLKQEYAVEQRQIQEDYKVRELRAKGLDAEADALEYAEQQQREYAAAVKAGADAATLAALEAAQAAEAIEHAAEAALQAGLTAASQSDQIHHVNTSTTAGAAQAFGEKAQQYAALGGSLGALFQGIDLAHITPEQIAALDTQFQALFDQLKKSPDTVDLAGLSVDDLIKALLDLDSSATSVANTIATAAQTISDAENQIAIADDILGTSAQGTISELSQAYGIDLSQFDLTKETGAKAAITYLQGLFTGLDPNDPNYKLVEHEIQTLVDKIRALFPDAGGAGSGGGLASGVTVPAGATSATASAVEGITHADANRLANLYSTMLGVDRQQLVVQQQILAALTRPIITGPILPPALPQGFGTLAPASAATRTATAAPAGGPTINLTLQVTQDIQFSGPVNLADAPRFSRELALFFSRFLASQLRDAQRLSGDTDIPTS